MPISEGLAKCKNLFPAIVKTFLAAFGTRWVFNYEVSMTDSQRLPVEYVRNGPEPAFRELVTRYIDLVYSAATRLVNGDAHLAQDIAQTLSVAVARKASGLSGDVMIGGCYTQWIILSKNGVGGEQSLKPELIKHLQLALARLTSVSFPVPQSFGADTHFRSQLRPRFSHFDA